MPLAQHVRYIIITEKMKSLVWGSPNNSSCSSMMACKLWIIFIDFVVWCMLAYMVKLTIEYTCMHLTWRSAWLVLLKWQFSFCSESSCFHTGRQWLQQTSIDSSPPMSLSLNQDHMWVEHRLSCPCGQECVWGRGRYSRAWDSPEFSCRLEGHLHVRDQHSFDQRNNYPLTKQYMVMPYSGKFS